MPSVETEKGPRKVWSPRSPSMKPSVRETVMNVPVNQSDFNDLVSEDLKTTSRIIAEKFGKRHSDVIRAIRDMVEKEPDWGLRNFASFKANDLTGDSVSHYELTRDGYSMLVMGFTGKAAMDWKIRFLEAFNAMEARLKTQPTTIDLHDPSQLVPLLSSYAQRTQVAETKVAELAPKAEAYDQIDALDGSLSIRPAAKVLSVPEHKLKTWLQVNKWAFRQNGKGPLQAYTDKRNVGYLDHKLGSYENSKGEKKPTITLMVTPKGLQRLASVFAKEGGAA